MLRNAMSHAVKALRKQCFAMSETTYFSMECSYASLPDDVIAASKRARFPKRIFKEREWNGNSSEGSTTGIGTQAGDSLQASSTEASATASIDSTSVKNQNARIEAAKIGRWGRMHDVVYAFVKQPNVANCWFMMCVRTWHDLQPLRGCFRGREDKWKVAHCVDGKRSTGEYLSQR